VIDNPELVAVVSHAAGGPGSTYDPANSQATTSWHRLVAAELVLIGVPEDIGGSGGDIDDLLAVASAIGHSGASFPLLETQVGTWLAAELGEPVDSRITTVLLPVESHWIGRWVDQASRVFAITEFDDGRCQATTVAAGTGKTVTDQCGEPVTVTTTLEETTSWRPVSRAAVDHVRHTLARGYLAQCYGALAAAVTLTLRYASTREQFGSSIDRFQRVQDLLCACVGETLIVKALLVGTDGGDGTPSRPGLAHAAAAARSAVGAAFHAVHQVHGAIGFTTEYPLHHYSLRAIAWCDAAALLLESHGSQA